MEILTSLIWVLVLIVIGFFVFKAIKSVIKTLMVMTAIVAIILILVFTFVYSDTSSFKKKFDTEPVVVLYEDHGKLLAGIRLESLSGGNATFITGTELSNIQSSYIAGRYSDIQEENYKVFFMLEEAFTEVEGPISADKQVYTKNFTLEIITSEDPLGTYIANQLGGEVSDQTKQNIASDLGLEDATVLKSRMFGLLYNQMIEEKGIKHLFIQYKKETVDVYPESAFFKFIRWVPVSFVGKFVDNAKEKAKDTIKEKI